MYFSWIELTSFPLETIVACVPDSHRNYTGIASFIKAPGWRVPDTPENRKALDGACLFPINMVWKAISDGTFYLPGGDWGQYELPFGVETCSDYYGFWIELTASNLELQ